MDPLVIEIPQQLLAPAESRSYEGEISLGAFDFGPDSYTTSAPLPWRVSISNVGGALLVTGSVTGEVATSCARCLDDTTLRIEGEVEGYFVIEGEGEAPEDMDEDEFDVLPESGIIDLEPLIRAAVYVELPLIPLCREDCAGLCPKCGANLNEGPCGCAPDEDEGDDAVKADNPFAALKGLKFD